MHKPFLTLFACFLFAFAPFKALCQDEEILTGYQNQIGINTTFFFKQFLNFSDNNTIAVSPYILTYKLISPKNHAFRIGVGGMLSNKTETFSNGAPPRKTNIQELDLSAGYEKRQPLSERWLCFFGADAVAHIESAKTVAEDISETVTTITKTNRYGAGPVVGIQFNISKRVSLFTETALLFQSSTASFETTFKNNPQFNDKETTKETTINFVVPTSLFLAINL